MEWLVFYHKFSYVKVGFDDMEYCSYRIANRGRFCRKLTKQILIDFNRRSSALPWHKLGAP